jgi:hypothetical protein
LKRILETVDEFYAIFVDQENEHDDVEIQTNVPLQDKIAGHNIVELKTTHIPKGLVPLKMLFDNNYVSKKSSIQIQEKDIVDYNIEMDTNTNIIKISKAL